MANGLFQIKQILSVFEHPIVGAFLGILRRLKERKSRMNRKKFVTGLLCMAGLLPVCAQQRVLSVEEMFRLADTNSRSIRSHRLAVDETRQGTKTAKSDKLPSIEANLSFSYIGNGWMTDRDFSDGQKASMPHYGNSFAIKATQVVYAGGAINRGVRLSELREQVAELELQDSRQEVRLLLVGYYLELYQLYNRQEVYEKNIEQTRMLVKEIQAAFQQGTALKSDITRYELQLQSLELGLTSTRNRIKVLNRQLTTTIGLDPETVNITTGMDYMSNYPLARKYTLGLTLKF